jgi:hypothetical protein
MAARTTSTGKPRAKRNRQNAAALKAWDTRLKANPDAGRAAALKAVKTRQDNIAKAIAEAEARGAAKAKRTRKAK